MRKIALLLCCFAMLGLTAEATTMTVTVNNTSGMFSSVAGATTNTFNSAPLSGTFSPYVENGITYSGDFGFYQGSTDGYHRAPTNDNTTYISVPRDNAGPSASFTLTGFAAGTNYFGLYWGSLDDYNSITFSNGVDSVTLTGTQLHNLTGVPFDCPPCGQAAATTYYNFFASEAFTTVTLSSTNRALETDNHAFATVPEPSSLALFGSGFLGLVGMFRRKLTVR